MKKVFCILACICCMFIVIGCGEKGEQSSAPEGNYDEVISQYDDYYLVYKDYSNFDKERYDIGILRADGTWAIEYGAFPKAAAEYESYRIKSSKYTEETGKYLDSSAYKGEYMPLEYWGNGVFAWCTNASGMRYGDWRAAYHCYSTETGKEFDIDEIPNKQVGTKADYFSDEYNIIRTDNGLSVYSLNGYEGQFDSSADIIGPYSDGGFVYYTSVKQLRFFDCATLTSTNICKDSRKIIASEVSNYRFLNGKCDISLLGADEKTYYATVDKNGNYIEEPHTYS